jgi:signal transduction histidine kinase
MRASLRSLLQPLPLAGLFTLMAVALSMRFVQAERLLPGAALLALFSSLFVLLQVLPKTHLRLHHTLLALMPLVTLTLIWLEPRAGTAAILLVVWAACIIRFWRWRVALIALLLVNLIFYLLERATSHSAPLTLVLTYAGFQTFAAICMHYAISAERARDLLAQTNAHLLATRSLLADSARDAERLRVARELHDVAGHKLTAIRLNLRELLADPALGRHDEIRLCERLSTELLDDIRNVVHELRDERGLALETALRALAAPLPRPRLELHIDTNACISDLTVAETLLRLVQEALTNAARHADAETLFVRIDRDGDALRLRIEDDGRVRSVLREGNGLSGMRERIDAARGTLRLDTNAHGALRIEAKLPA